MSDIFVPPSLTGADAAKGILDLLEKLNDPNNRKRIESDIVAAHALNDTEAKKHADALKLIQKHSDILSETQKAQEQLKSDKIALDAKETSFKSEVEVEHAKLNAKTDAVKDDTQKAAELFAQANDLHNTIAVREDELRQAKEIYQANLVKYQADLEALKTKQNEIEKFRQQVLNLDRQTKEKVEALKKYNF